MPVPTNYFKKMIWHLRHYEEVVLYANIIQTEQAEELEVTTFLATEYLRESASYPYSAPPFDAEAAIWAAKTVYTAAQLILYRENKEAELATLLPTYAGMITPSAILSADICLRFLPDMIFQLRVIDSEDELINLLEQILTKWHYSGIKFGRWEEARDLSHLTESECLRQLYTDRVIECRNLKLAMQPMLQKNISASLGDLSSVYWNDFKTETTIHE